MHKGGYAHLCYVPDGQVTYNTEFYFQSPKDSPAGSSLPGVYGSGNEQNSAIGLVQHAEGGPNEAGI